MLSLRRWGPHQKTCQNSSSGAFFTLEGPAECAWERTLNRRSLATERLPEGGVEGGEGGEFLQNSRSGAFLSSGIYLNRRGSKMAMPLGSIFIPPLLAPTLPRLSSTTPLASRPWPLARQKHALRSNSGAFSGREGSAGFQLGYTFAGFMLAGHVFRSGWTPLMT